MYSAEALSLLRLCYFYLATSTASSLSNEEESNLKGMMGYRARLHHTNLTCALRAVLFSSPDTMQSFQ